ncbi:hypothetical protein WICPIJ_004019 [Wickerhamomyces pijperi]|uniref:Uncharacterized protein n=1 Tax=Wickerhamomyces pijperi TaxID=599730 RepID=A0A9P8Q8H2_WICPI|nr:hypothetical protein WICPIJ_004019 [Wickerhamomyces pijperi]
MPLVCKVLSSIGVEEYRSSFNPVLLGLLLEILCDMFTGGTLDDELVALDLAGDVKLLFESLFSANSEPGRLEVDEELEFVARFEEDDLKEFVILEKKLKEDVLLLLWPRVGGVVQLGDAGSWCEVFIVCVTVMCYSKKRG